MQMSANEPGGADDGESVRFVVAQSSTVHVTWNGCASTMRSVPPCTIAEMGRATLEDFHAAGEFALVFGDGVAFFDDGDAVEDRPSATERSSLTYSAWAQTSGCAEPAERPKYRPSGGQVGVVPHLLRQHAADGAELLHAP